MSAAFPAADGGCAVAMVLSTVAACAGAGWGAGAAVWAAVDGALVAAGVDAAGALFFLQAPAKISKARRAIGWRCIASSYAQSVRYSPMVLDFAAVGLSA